MKTDFCDEPRQFEVKGVTIRDMGKIRLEGGEMVSFVTQTGRECDFTATPWGFYLGPSLNSRLKNEGFRAALVLNNIGRIFVMAVEKDKIPEFEEYIHAEAGNTVLCWLDEWAEGHA